MSDSKLEIVGDEFLTSIDHCDEFHVNLLFDRSIYRPMCAHRGKIIQYLGFYKSVSYSQDVELMDKINQQHHYQYNIFLS